MPGDAQPAARVEAGLVTANTDSTRRETARSAFALSVTASLIASGLVAALTLGGIVVGQRLQQAHDDSGYLREKRREAYVAFLQAAMAFRDDLQDTQKAGSNSPKLLPDFTAMGQALPFVELVGTAKAIELAGQVVSLDPPVAGQPVNTLRTDQKALDDFQERISNFVAEARAEVS